MGRWDDCTEEDMRVIRVLDDNGNETNRLICGECGEEWEPPPGEDGFVCNDCAVKLEEDAAWRDYMEATDEYDRTGD